MSVTEVQLSDGDAVEGAVWVKANGWVKVEDDQGKIHYPPNQVERIVGEANYQSPHGRI